MRPWYRFVSRLAHGVGWLVWGLRVEGRENVPRSGPLVLTSNHVSILDPPVLGAVVPRECAFAAKKELFAVPGLSALIRSLNSIPVDRARLSRATLRRFGDALAEEKVLIFFPEGTRSRSGVLGNAREGVGMVLSRHPVPILPVVVEGTDSLFRNLFRRGRMRVVFGAPYTLPREDPAPSSRRERYRRIAETVMERIRQVREGPTTGRKAASPDETRAPRSERPRESPEDSGIREKGRD